MCNDCSIAVQLIIRRSVWYHTCTAFKMDYVIIFQQRPATSSSKDGHMTLACK